MPETLLARRQVLLVIVSMVFSMGLAVLALRQVDWSGTVLIIRNAPNWFWIPLGICCYVSGQFLRGARVRFLVSKDATIDLKTATNVVVLGYAANNVLPARLGEVVRATMLTQRTGIPVSQSLSITALERILDAIVILTGLAVASLYLPSVGVIGAMLAFGVPVIGLGAVAYFLLTLNPAFLAIITSRLTHALGVQAHDFLVRQALFISRGLRSFRSARDVAITLTLSVAAWTLEAAMYGFILSAVGLPVDPLWALAAMAVTNIGILTPSWGGYVGGFLYFCTLALVDLGVSAEVALDYATLVLVTFFVPVTLWGAVILLLQGLEFGAILSLRTMSPSGTTSSSQVPGAELIAVVEERKEPPLKPELVTCICEALFADELARIAQPERQKAVHSAGLFVSSSLAALPPMLRMLMKVGLFGFSAIVGISQFCSFAKLPSARRRAIVESWAYGRFGPARQFFKPIRSTALLAFYEHPAVVESLETDRLNADNGT